MNQDNDPTVLVSYVDANGKQTKVGVQIAGVGGWLAWLIFGLMILVPLIKLGGIGQFDEMHSTQLAMDVHWQTFKTSLWVIELVLGTMSVAAGFRLWKKHSHESVKFAIVVLWVSGPFGNLLKWIAAILTIGGGENGVKELVNPTVGLILAGIFTAYLLRSVRVKNTYIYSS